MDRKGIIGVAIAIIVLVWWQVDYSRKMQKYSEAQRAAEAAKKLSAPQGVAETTGGITDVATKEVVPATPGIAATEAPAAEEKKEVISSPSVQYTFTSRGGGIARAELLKHVAEIGRVDGDETKVVINQLGPIPIGAITERAGDAAIVPFNLRSAQDGEVIMERTDSRQLQTVKKFTLPKTQSLADEYTVTLDVTFSNKASQPVDLPAYFVHSGAAAPIHKNDQPYYTGVSYFHDGKSTFKQLGSFSAGGFLGFGKQAQPMFTESAGNVSWLGVTNQYFATIIRPLDVSGNAVWGQKFHMEKAQIIGVPGGIAPVDAVEGAVGMPGMTLAPGQSVTQKFNIYVGPREQRRLAALGANQEKVMDFGMFAPISKTLLASMNWLHAQFNSYAAAIIVLTLVIKSLLWPLQNKATNSMKKMQALQPKMTELREKYQDDPQRMNMELMKLYKDYGVNPFGGCLPMLVQIPIFFGFYNMLGKAVELRNSHFLWVKDLSQPDTIGHLAQVPINVLPLVMAGTMFWQMSLSPKSGDPVQQRVFMFMPLIFVFFCYNFASALALYWTVQNLFSVVQLYLTRNKATPALQKVTGPVKKKRA